VSGNDVQIESGVLDVGSPGIYVWVLMFLER
jgi:hypothetical protein